VFRVSATAFVLALAASLVVACGGDDDDSPPPAREACADRNALRNVYFGDLHVHTANSFDSYAFDVRNTPEDAYRFAMGEPATLPPLGAAQTLRLDRPLDFAAVTDHAEFLGEVDICLTEGTDGYESNVCEQFRDNGPLGQTLMGIALTDETPERDANICGADSARCLDAARSIWESEIEAAETFYDRSTVCAFTTFVAYEYTSNKNFSARHRNVIFRGNDAPFPISYLEEQTPQGLWEALRRECIEAGTGCDALAIPHNTNQGNGNTFFPEYPGAVTEEEERHQAEQRAAIEPLVEIYQHKGDSECMNGLSGITGAPDELCEFEKLRSAPFEDCGDTPGSGGVAGGGCVSHLEFVRGALLEGLRERRRIGANPYRLGIIASTDTHNGTPGAVDEASFLGHRGGVDDEVGERLGVPTFRAGPIFGPGGLAAVWAEENTRESLFDAMRRREVYGTSGPRIVARFFGGWGLPSDLCDDPDHVRTADTAGVPMGSVLPESPATAAAPSFLTLALRDPGTADRPGTPLQRVQIIKGWIENDEAHQRIFDVAGDPDNGASVDGDCRPVGNGFNSLCGVWTDPEFVAGRNTFYYMRVIENPTCRWTALQCNASADPTELESCDDPQTVKILQERAWTSPIWYEG
jgi:hypothetical protein